MGKWRCKCGHAMNDHNCPDENCYLVYSDLIWDTITCDENGNVNFSEDIPDPAYDVYKCPQCGRLMIFGEDNRFIFYKREDT